MKKILQYNSFDIWMHYFGSEIQCGSFYGVIGYLVKIWNRMMLKEDEKMKEIERKERIVRVLTAPSTEIIVDWTDVRLRKAKMENCFWRIGLLVMLKQWRNMQKCKVTSKERIETLETLVRSKDDKIQQMEDVIVEYKTVLKYHESSLLDTRMDLQKKIEQLDESETSIKQLESDKVSLTNDNRSKEFLIKQLQSQLQLMTEEMSSSFETFEEYLKKLSKCTVKTNDGKSLQDATDDCNESINEIIEELESKSKKTVQNRPQSASIQQDSQNGIQRLFFLNNFHQMLQAIIDYANSLIIINHLNLFKILKTQEKESRERRKSTTTPLKTISPSPGSAKRPSTFSDRVIGTLVGRKKERETPVKGVVLDF